MAAPKKTGTPKKKAPSPKKKSHGPANVLQFLVTLEGIKPKIWRRILVPAEYSMWDLHVAIQDAMGWLDCHLHVFRDLSTDPSGELMIGLQHPELADLGPETSPGWEERVGTHFERPGDEATYEYDFGDGWEHTVTLEAVLVAEPGKRYPLCVAGERACPPEDCGGPFGYQEMLKTLKKKRGPEYASLLEWLGGPFEAESFHPEKVRFEDPKKRLKRVLGTR